MGKSKKFEFTSKVDINQAADYLQNMANALREGKVTLSDWKEKIHLQPGDDLTLEIEGERNSSGTKGKIELELSWKIHNPVAKDSLIINSESDKIEDDDDEDEDDEDSDEKESTDQDKTSLEENDDEEDEEEVE